MTPTERPDMTLVEKGGWWYRAGLHDTDFCGILTAYVHDDYHLGDWQPARIDEVVVDVGACIGAFSRLAHVRNPTAKIIAVETNRHNIECLRANVGDFATIVPKALTYETDVALLDSIYEGTNASGGSTVKPTAEVQLYAGEQYIPVAEPLETITIEQIIKENGIDFIDVIKLDCEGSEHSILANTTSLDRIGVIVGEFHGGRSRWADLVRRRFSPASWFHMAWNHHDHMGNFVLVNQKTRCTVDRLEHFYGQIEGWFDFQDVYASVAADPKAHHIVEVGAWKGRSAAFMAVEIANSGRRVQFDVVDTWRGSVEHAGDKDLAAYNGDILPLFLNNIASVRRFLNPMQMESVAASRLYPDKSLDFVFIDASHDYDSVKRDISHWLPKVRTHGILAGHDYCLGDVKRAVDELLSPIQISRTSWIHHVQ